ncbi:hypothetical protein TNCV_1111551 [Trichonephila clavipes]|nr:hypothetical protein TNCV_1111551 [Trichonephila clavipes]
MLSKVYGESSMARSKVYKWYRRFKESQKSIEDNERVRRHSIPRTRKMLRWFLNVFEKIVAKHLHKSLKLHTSRRHHLREPIRRKLPQFWQ